MPAVGRAADERLSRRGARDDREVVLAGDHQSERFGDIREARADQPQSRSP